MIHLRGTIRPNQPAQATADTARGKKRLSSEQIQAILMSDGIPLGECRLKAVLDQTPKDNMTFLLTQYGKPFTANGFGNWMRDRCDEAELPVCSCRVPADCAVI